MEVYLPTRGDYIASTTRLSLRLFRDKDTNFWHSCLISPSLAHKGLPWIDWRSNCKTATSAALMFSFSLCQKRSVESGRSHARLWWLFRSRRIGKHGRFSLCSRISRKMLWRWWDNQAVNRVQAMERTEAYQHLRTTFELKREDYEFTFTCPENMLGLQRGVHEQWWVRFRDSGNAGIDDVGIKKAYDIWLDLV